MKNNSKLLIFISMSMLILLFFNEISSVEIDLGPTNPVYNILCVGQLKNKSLLLITYKFNVFLTNYSDYNEWTNTWVLNKFPKRMARLWPWLTESEIFYNLTRIDSLHDCAISQLGDNDLRLFLFGSRTILAVNIDRQTIDSLEVNFTYFQKQYALSNPHAMATVDKESKENSKELIIHTFNVVNNTKGHNETLQIDKTYKYKYCPNQFFVPINDKMCKIEESLPIPNMISGFINMDRELILLIPNHTIIQVGLDHATKVVNISANSYFGMFEIKIFGRSTSIATIFIVLLFAAAIIEAGLLVKCSIDQKKLLEQNKNQRPFVAYQQNEVSDSKKSKKAKAPSAPLPEANSSATQIGSSASKQPSAGDSSASNNEGSNKTLPKETSERKR